MCRLLPQNEKMCSKSPTRHCGSGLRILAPARVELTWPRRELAEADAPTRTPVARAGVAGRSERTEPALEVQVAKGAGQGVASEDRLAPAVGLRDRSDN